MIRRNEKIFIVFVAIVSFIVGIFMGYILDTNVLQKFPEKENVKNTPITGICGCVLLHESNTQPANALLMKMPSSPHKTMCNFK